MKQQKTTLLRVFDTLPEACLAKDALEQNGVPCFLSNESIYQMYPVFGSSFGGIHLHIFEDDMERANDILDNLPNNNA